MHLARDLIGLRRGHCAFAGVSRIAWSVQSSAKRRIGRVRRGKLLSKVIQERVAYATTRETGLRLFARTCTLPRAIFRDVYSAALASTSLSGLFAWNNSSRMAFIDSRGDARQERNFC